MDMNRNSHVLYRTIKPISSLTLHTGDVIPRKVPLHLYIWVAMLCQVLLHYMLKTWCQGRSLFIVYSSCDTMSSPLTLHTGNVISRKVPLHVYIWVVILCQVKSAKLRISSAPLLLLHQADVIELYITTASSSGCYRVVHYYCYTKWMFSSCTLLLLHQVDAIELYITTATPSECYRVEHYYCYAKWLHSRFWCCSY